MFKLYMLGLVGLMVGGCGAKDNDRIGERMAPSSSDDSTVKPPAQTPPSSPTPQRKVDPLPPPVDQPTENGQPTTDDDAEYKKLLEACGGIDPTLPDKLVVDQVLEAIPARQTGREVILGVPVNYRVDIGGELTVQSSISGHTNLTALTVLAAQPTLAQGIANKRVAAQNGLIKQDYLTYADRGALADRHPSWAGITCSIQPGVKATNDVGGHVVATLDPPIPVSISPLPTSARFDQEITGKRVWSGVKATIVESTNPNVKVGEVIDGTVTVEPIATTGVAIKPDGSTETFSADHAFQISVVFGTPLKTAALGLKPVTKYYVDHKFKQFNAIVAELQDGASPIMSFVMRRP